MSPFLKASKSGLPVAIKFDPDAVEIEKATIDRQVAAPIVVDPHIFDRLSGRHVADLVRTRAERWRQKRGLERVRFIVGFGDDGKFGDGQDRAVGLLAIEFQAHGGGVDDFCRFETHQRKLHVVVALLLIRLEGVGDIGGSQRGPIVEPRLGSELEFECVPIVRNGHRFGQQTVERIGLVQRSHHQGVETHLNARRAVALRREAVQRVEGEGTLVEDPVGRRKVEQAALRRIRVHIVEVREIGWIFEIAEGRQSMQFRAARSLGEGATGQERSGSACCANGQEIAPGKAQCRHCRRSRCHLAALN